MVPCVTAMEAGDSKLAVQVALVTDQVAEAEQTAVPVPVAPVTAFVTDMEPEGLVSGTEEEQKFDGPQDTVPAAQFGAEATLITT